MKQIAFNITINCLREGGYEKLIAAMDPLWNTEWNPVAQDLTGLNLKINELYYTVIPSIEREKKFRYTNLQKCIDQMIIMQNTFYGSKLLEYNKEKRYNKVHRIPIVSLYYKERYISAKNDAESRKSDVWISKKAAMACQGEAFARKKLLFGLNNLFQVMVDAHSKLEDVYLNNHTRI
jgi:hypothetical protein